MLEVIERVNIPKDQRERETVTIEKLALSNAYQLEAVLNVLERKGVLIPKEVLDELDLIVTAKGKKTHNGCE